MDSVTWKLMLTHFVTSLQVRSWGAVGKTMCPTNNSTVRLARALVTPGPPTQVVCTLGLTLRLILPRRWGLSDIVLKGALLVAKVGGMSSAPSSALGHLAD